MPPPPRLLVVPGDARCAARLGRYKRAECSCTVGDGCRKEIEQRRSRSRSRWRWIGDGDRAADGSTSRACLERVGWGARLLAVQPAEGMGRSETNSTYYGVHTAGLSDPDQSDTSTWLLYKHAFSLLYAMTSDVAFSGSVRAPCHAAVPHSPLWSLHAHAPRWATGQARMERGRREVCGEPSDCIPFGQRGSVQDLHMIST